MAVGVRYAVYDPRDPRKGKLLPDPALGQIILGEGNTITKALQAAPGKDRGSGGVRGRWRPRHAPAGHARFPLVARTASQSGSQASFAQRDGCCSGQRARWAAQEAEAEMRGLDTNVLVRYLTQDD